MKCAEPNWFCKRMEKVRSSQASIYINPYTEMSKIQYFPVRIVKISADPTPVPFFR